MWGIARALVSRHREIRHVNELAIWKKHSKRVNAREISFCYHCRALLLAGVLVVATRLRIGTQWRT